MKIVKELTHPYSIILYVLTMFSLLIKPVSAQAQLHTKLEGWGLKSGLNVTFISEASGDEARNRFNLGTSYRLKLVKSLYFAPELVFQARGAKFSSGFLFPPINLNIMSIDTPALFRYTFARKNGWMFTSGPNISFAFRTRASIRNEGQTISTSASEFTNTVTFGWIGDIGYRIPALNGAFILAMRYKRGLSAQFEDSDGAKNDIFSVNVGFEF